MIIILGIWRIADDAADFYECLGCTMPNTEV